MFHQRLKILYLTFHLTNSEIARHAGCSPSHISHIYSGARIPAPGDLPLTRLIDGIYSFAQEHSILDALSDFCGCKEADSEEKIKGAIKSWLYDTSSLPSDSEVTPIDLPPVHTKSYSYFSIRLNSLMNLLDFSNVQLSKLLCVDASHISRFRNGVRIPKLGAPLSNLMCKVLAIRLMEQNMVEEVALLMHVTPSLMTEQGDCIHLIRNWLYEIEKDKSFMAIDHLLMHIKTLSPINKGPLPSLEEATKEIVSSTSEHYYGTVGLQTAVLRLLSKAVYSNAKELWLYSDQNIEWLIKDHSFLAKWYTLMYTCVTHGIHIKIIHNIDRDIPEMFAGIESWLSLYMSGMVTSFYCPKELGARFAHTFFLCPECAAITGCLIPGTETEGLYHYYEQSSILQYLEAQYVHLLSLCKPLVHTHLLSQQTQDDIEIKLENNTVTVIRNQYPYVAFVFSHPLMFKAFKEYMKDE